jgi:multiple sugar transport system permease protein
MVKKTSEHRDAVGPVARDQRRTGMLFVLLPMSLFLVFSVYPMLYAAYLSMMRFSFTQAPTFIGIANFQRLISDSVFHTAFSNTLIYTLGVVPVGISLALGLAVLLNQKVRGVTLFRVAFYLPVVTSTVASGMIWLWMYAPDSGLVNRTLSAIGVNGPRWLIDPDWALLSVMIVAIWKNLGYTMIIFLAALQGVPVHLYEAAEIDGANAWKKFWAITVPLLRPATFFIFVTSLISSFQVFGSVYVMTQGGPGYATTTIVHQIYLNAFRYQRMGYASAEALILFIVIFSLSLLNWRYVRSDVEYW